MAVRKSLSLLAILILTLPVGIVLFLHAFGDNKMEIPILASLADCEVKKGAYSFISGRAETSNQKNQLARIKKRLASKRMHIDSVKGKCFQDTLALLLIDERANLRGVYELEHNDINRFFAELDILLMSKNYDKEDSK